MSLFFSVSVAGDVFAIELLVKERPLSARGAEMMPTEVLVKFKPGITSRKIDQINARHSVTEMVGMHNADVKRLKIPTGKTVKEMVSIYNNNPNVEYAEPNFTARALWTPDDPYYIPYQWNFDNPAYGGINMEAAWAQTTGDPAIIVAVVDTGVAFEDYQEQVSFNKWVTYQKAPDFVNTSFVSGYDFINNDNHPNDDEGHGTHVAGTIAQSSNNNLGVAGIAFNTTIMPIKVLDSEGIGNHSTIADGIYYAADHGARIINLSLGSNSPSNTLENALAYAFNHGVINVCASGNDGSKSTINYPAAYDAYCIAVGATRYDESVASYSNQGASLDLTAPGGDNSIDQNGDGYIDGILQQTFGSNPTDFGYYFYQGTSMAAPHVSGVSALLLAQDATRTANDVREILQVTAEDNGPLGWDPIYGWGILDATAALNYDVLTNQAPVAVIDAPSSGTEGSAVTFDGSLSYDDDDDPLTFTWDFGDGTNGSGVRPDHVYTEGGREYTVSLTVNDGMIDSNPAIVNIWVNEVIDAPVQLESNLGTYMTIQAAYDSINLASADIIKIKEGEHNPEDLTFNRDVTLYLRGGYDYAFANIVSNTSLSGTFIVSSGRVIVTDVIIK